ncbi:MAG: S8 family serine peptidase, partial [Akkermansiaceae bacterium]|nr:S8 family serine peptidase [Akkermansiaceae bacterium]
MRSSQTRLLAAVLAVLFLLTAVLIFQTKPDREGNPPLAGSPADPVQANSQAEGESAPRLEKKSRKQEMAGAPIVDSEETWDFNQGGQTVSIRLALDEAVVREPNGKDRIIPLNPPATSETLSSRLAAIEEEGVVLPVAYVVGQDRSQFTRRIVTPDLSVKMEGSAADSVAAAHDLVVKSRPEYAPGWVIMSAPSPFAALDAMVNLREVREVASADVLLAVQRSLRALPNDPLVTNQWHLKKTASSSAGTDVNIETIWNYPSTTGSRGTGIRVGVVDDGLETAHPDLAVNVDTANDKDWNGNDADPNPGAGDDHGTACAGNVAARGNNGIGVSGTAPNSTLVGMRLIAAATTDAQEAEAMYYLPQLIEIKSNSWGPSDTGTLLEGPGSLTAAALKNAAELGRGGKGNIILWAGGNGGSAADNSNYDGYANSIYTIAIGATNSSGNRSSYSEPGSNIVVCAPSSGALGITTVDRTGTNGYESGDYTSTFGGTSSATPTAAGIVALMLEKNPNLGWRDVQEILIRTAAKIKPTDSDWVTNGAGLSFNHNFGAGNRQPD